MSKMEQNRHSKKIFLSIMLVMMMIIAGCYATPPKTTKKVVIQSIVVYRNNPQIMRSAQPYGEILCMDSTGHFQGITFYSNELTKIRKFRSGDTIVVNYDLLLDSLARVHKTENASWSLAGN